MNWDQATADRRRAERESLQARYPEFWRAQRPPVPNPDAVRVVRALLRGERP